MAQPEEKIVKIVDTTTHTRGVSVEQVGSQGALIVKSLETEPTDGNNPSTDLSYDVDGNLQYIDETIDGTTYRTTLTYTDGVLTNISAAVEQ